MSFRQISNRATGNKYKTYEDFESDILSVFDNAAMYYVRTAEGRQDIDLLMKYCEQGRKAYRKYGNVLGKRVAARDPEIIVEVRGVF